MCQDHFNKRGVSLQDKKAHQEDHQEWSRRGFLKSLGLAGGSALAFGGFSLQAMATGTALPLMYNRITRDRILVLIRLKGGNDGLNMIVPTFDYGTYKAARPTVGIDRSEILPLNDAFGIPKTMESIMPMWNDGHMKVVNTVGYDDHNLSHFTSSDIWNAANPDIDNTGDKSGWLGRFILENNPNYLEDLPPAPGAIKIKSGSNIAFQSADQIDLAVNFNSPDRLISLAESGFVYDTENLPDDCYYGEQVGFLRSLLNVTYQYAPQISEAYKKGENKADYQLTDLSRQLAIVARLIKGNLGTKLYMVTINGFDTHENQNNDHPKLMNELTTAISAFYEDLQEKNLDKNVLSMTFSEFGRRIKENQGGTDHGTAAPVMLFGPALDGNGVLGDAPDLEDVDENGNLKHSIDFRSIYASILENWLCMNPLEVDQILGGSYERLDNLGLRCLRTPTTKTPIAKGLRHGTRPDNFGGTVIEYSIEEPADIDVSIFAITGQKVANLFQGYQTNGTHEVTYNTSFSGMASAPLIYRIRSNGKQYSGKFMVQH